MIILGKNRQREPSKNRRTVRELETVWQEAAEDRP